MVAWSAAEPYYRALWWLVGLHGHTTGHHGTVQAAKRLYPSRSRSKEKKDFKSSLQNPRKTHASSTQNPRYFHAPRQRELRAISRLFHVQQKKLTLKKKKNSRS